MGGNREARGGETEIVVVFRMVAKGAESSKNFFFSSDLDCAITSSRGRTKKFTLKNQVYRAGCEETFMGSSMACLVLIER